jgi:hypothetical protein
MKAGPRDKLVGIWRAGPAFNDGYTMQPGALAEVGTTYAEVRFGTGQERREAAQESAVIAATFVMDANEFTRSIAVTDTLRFQDGDWDISSSIPGRDRSEWQVTATRSAQAA